jgi:hypothetical protein
MKACFKCGLVKPLNEYYRHPAMGDGRLGKCKECAKKDANRHRSENLEDVQAYDRMRGQDPKRKANVKKRYHEIYAGSDIVKKYHQKWLDNNKEKRSAHIVVGNAVKRGDLIRKPCERCGKVKGVHGHHEDYSKPLEVIWLCKKHHGERHREINEQQRAHLRTIQASGQVLG